jgi:hypothetical protein
LIDRYEEPAAEGDITRIFASILVDHEHDHVHLAKRHRGRIHHALVHAVRRLVDARGVDEHDLAGGARADAENPVPRGLGLVGDDRDLLADEPVEERGFASVGPPHERDQSGLHASSASTSGEIRLRRTL